MNNWRSSREYRTWRVHVIRRDKVCQVCRSKKNRHAHHLSDASSYPELRFDVKNGIVLCKKCHTSLHCDYNDGFKSICTEKDFEEYLKISKYLFSRFKENTIKYIKLME